ncbi:class I SAM-dependent methyltransferase [Patescibacteria group bacterium]|nr:class I SAM-dependent methyltransferase [Patescibacteria group bacterium]MBU1563899.1 class I SAM-dependent methyltransferase [Patescibacteria group bacterium]MBU2068128.1 class I SAM-dependent methyltransferase [Patescibacteria group bacterium]
MNNSKWEQYYQNISLDKIPWNKTQADYFIKIISESKIKPCLALDLGCGVGRKSIYLVKKGFDVTGVDISKTAIRFAEKNAEKAKVKVDFIVADVTDLSFLRGRKFDFVLDWANLHGIPKNKRERYVSEIIKHTKKGGKFLLRCFARDKAQKEFVIRRVGRVYVFSKEDIKSFFSSHFKFLEMNRSKPFGEGSPSKWFDEYLMERI